jgi:hypothetical protein
MTFRLLVIFSFFVISVISVTEDQNDNCMKWASAGECDNNQGYMLQNCATSCDVVAKQMLQDTAELQSIGSFFELQANDIFGRPVQFSNFKGKVTLVRTK